jgi:hypothetical protein
MTQEFIDRHNVAGKEFGRLRVIEFNHKDNKGLYWKCLCSCGNTSIVRQDSLKSGNTFSCGCWKKETAARNGRLQRKGYGIVNNYGLIYKPDHVRANPRGYVIEHLLIMEAMLKRPLLQGETVHHNDLNRKNNQPYNLRLFSSNSEHLKFHRKMERENIING